MLSMVAMKTIRQLLRNFRYPLLAAAWLTSGIPLLAAPYADAELLVKCEGGPSGELARAADTSVGGTTVRRFEAIGWHLVRLPEGVSAAQGLARYRAQPGVLKVEPNRQVPQRPEPLPPPAEVAPENDPAIRQQAVDPNAVRPNDPRYGSQWNLKRIGMEAAWGITTGSTNVVVAVIDTGVNYLHPDLAANMWHNPGETGLDAQGRDKAANGIDDDGNGYVDDVHGINTFDDSGDPMDRGFTSPPVITTPHYHGTAIAGVIGAVGNNGTGLSGINWDVRIMAIAYGYGDNTLPVGPAGKTVDYLLAAYDYVVKMKSRGVNIRVANNSYSLDIQSESVMDAFKALHEADILMVFSAGNDGTNSELTWWRFSMIDSPNVIAVTGVNRSDQQLYDFGVTSTDLAAPTPEIIAPTKGTAYVTDFGGTSAACPHVVGAAALLCAAQPDITLLGIKAALFSSVDQLAALKGKTRTGGRLNVARALQSLTNANPPAIVLYAAPGASRTDPAAPIEMIFNRPMDRASVEAAFAVQPAVSGTFEWSADSRSFRHRPNAPFARELHTLTLAGTAKSADGDTLDGNFNGTPQGAPADDYVWTFRFAQANDDLAGAEHIEGMESSVTGNNTRGTAELGEPDFKEARWYLWGSVWYRWTAPRSGWFTFDLRGSAFNTTLGVFQGTNYQQFLEVTSNNDYGTRRQSRVTFAAEIGAIYSIAIGGDYSDSNTAGDGNFTLRWYPTPPPAIASFSPLSGVPGQVITLNGTNFTGATSVKLNGVAAAFTPSTNATLSDLRLLVALPPDAATGRFTVETPQGSATAANEFAVFPVPVLTVETASDGSLILSWPEPATGFALQATDRLGPDTNWKAAVLPDAQPALTGRIRRTALPSDAARFYRLRRP